MTKLAKKFYSVELVKTSFANFEWRVVEIYIEPDSNKKYNISRYLKASQDAATVYKFCESLNLQLAMMQNHDVKIYMDYCNSFFN